MDIKTISDIEVAVLGSPATRRNQSLPQIDMFRVDIASVSDSVKGSDGRNHSCRDNRHVAKWQISVQIHGEGGFKPAVTVAAKYGMKLPKQFFSTKEEAFAVALSYKSTWGKATSKTGRKNEEAKREAVEEAVKSVKDKLVSGLKAMGLSEVAIATILAKAA